MALNFTKQEGGKKYAPMDTGTFAARIVQIIDFGIQEVEWQGEIKNSPRVYITFEFPTETINVNGEEKPRWLSKEYLVSMAEKSALLKLVNSVDPEGKITKNGTNVKALLGQPLSIIVGRTSSGNAKVTDVGPLMKGMQVKELQNPSVFFDLESEDVATFNNLPHWIKEKITSGPEFNKTKFSKALASSPGMNVIEEDIPY